jgi:hypothetical protein
MLLLLAGLVFFVIVHYSESAVAIRTLLDRDGVHLAAQRQRLLRAAVVAVVRAENDAGIGVLPLKLFNEFGYGDRSEGGHLRAPCGARHALHVQNYTTGKIVCQLPV